jgi:hypothetical protein
MPSTRTVDDSEALLADAWVKCAKPGIIRSYEENVRRYSSGQFGFRVHVHNSLRDAVRLKVLKSKYEHAFMYALMLPRCRSKKQRAVQAVTQSAQSIALKKLTDSWMRGNVEEQADTWTRLKTALEENRSSNRNLFS